MNVVEPIRDLKKITKIKNILFEKSKRDYLLFVLGINCGLRISDILKLRFKDVLITKKQYRDNITVHEKKTGKIKRFALNRAIKEAITIYTAELVEFELNDFIFNSRKSTFEGSPRPIGRQQAYAIIKQAATEAGIFSEIGTHTLRKTFGYHARIAGTPIEIIQQLFNHSSPSITKRYIGIQQDEMDEVYLNLNL